MVERVPGRVEAKTALSQSRLEPCDPIDGITMLVLKFPFVKATAINLSLSSSLRFCRLSLSLRPNT